MAESPSSPHISEKQRLTDKSTRDGTNLKFTALARSLSAELNTDPNINILSKQAFLNLIRTNFTQASISPTFKDIMPQVLICDIADMSGTNRVGREHGDRLIAMVCATLEKTCKDFVQKSLQAQVTDLDTQSTAATFVDMIEISITGGDEIAIYIPLLDNTQLPALNQAILTAISTLKRAYKSPESTIAAIMNPNSELATRVSHDTAVKLKNGAEIMRTLTAKDYPMVLNKLLDLSSKLSDKTQSRPIDAHWITQNVNALLHNLNEAIGNCPYAKQNEAVIWYINKILSTAIEHRQLITLDDALGIARSLASQDKQDVITNNRIECLKMWSKKTQLAAQKLKRQSAPSILNSIRKLNSKYARELEAKFGESDIPQDALAEIANIFLNPTFGEFVGNREMLDERLKDATRYVVVESKGIKEFNDNYGMYFADEYVLNSIYKSIMAKIPAHLKDSVTVYVDIQTFYLIPDPGVADDPFFDPDHPNRLSINELTLGASLDTGHGALKIPATTVHYKPHGMEQKNRESVAKEVDIEWSKIALLALDKALGVLQRNGQVMLPFTLPSKVYERFGTTTYFFEETKTSIELLSRDGDPISDAYKTIFAVLPYLTNSKRSFDRISNIFEAIRQVEAGVSPSKSKYKNIKTFLKFLDQKISGVNYKANQPVGPQFRGNKEIVSGEMICGSNIANALTQLINLQLGSLSAVEHETKADLSKLKERMSATQYGSDYYVSSDIVQIEKDYIDLYLMSSPSRDKTQSYEVLTLLKTLAHIACIKNLKESNNQNTNTLSIFVTAAHKLAKLHSRTTSLSPQWQAIFGKLYDDITKTKSQSQIP